MCPGWRGRPGALPEVGPTRHLLGGAPRRVRSGTVSPPGDVLPNCSRSLLPRRRPPAPPRPAPAEASDERWVKTENGAAVASGWKEASDRSTKVEYTYIQRYHSAMPEDVGMTPLRLLQAFVERLSVAESKYASEADTQSRGLHTMIMWLPRLKAIKIAARARDCRRGLLHHGVLSAIVRVLRNAQRCFRQYEETVRLADGVHLDESIFTDLRKYARHVSCWNSAQPDASTPPSTLRIMLLYATVESIGDTLRRLVDLNAVEGTVAVEGSPMRQPLTVVEVMNVMHTADIFSMVANMASAVYNVAQHVPDIDMVVCSALYLLDVLKFWVSNERDASQFRKSPLRSMLVGMLGFPKECVVDGSTFTAVDEERLTRYLHLQVAAIDLTAALLDQHPSHRVDLGSFGLVNVLRDSILWVSVYFAKPSVGRPPAPDSDSARTASRPAAPHRGRPYRNAAGRTATRAPHWGRPHRNAAGRTASRPAAPHRGRPYRNAAGRTATRAPHHNAGTGPHWGRPTTAIAASLASASRRRPGK